MRWRSGTAGWVRDRRGCCAAGGGSAVCQNLGSRGREGRWPRPAPSFPKRSRSANSGVQQGGPARFFHSISSLGGGRWRVCTFSGGSPSAPRLHSVLKFATRQVRTRDPPASGGCSCATLPPVSGGRVSVRPAFPRFPSASFEVPGVQPCDLPLSVRAAGVQPAAPAVPASRCR